MDGRGEVKKIVSIPLDGRMAWTLQESMAGLWPGGDPVPDNRETLVTILSWQVDEDAPELSDQGIGLPDDD